MRAEAGRTSIPIISTVRKNVILKFIIENYFHKWAATIEK